MNNTQRQEIIEKVTGFGTRYITGEGEFVVTTNRRSINIQKINEGLKEMNLQVIRMVVNDAGNITLGVA